MNKQEEKNTPEIAAEHMIGVLIAPGFEVKEKVPEKKPWVCEICKMEKYGLSNIENHKRMHAEKIHQRGRDQLTEVFDEVVGVPKVPNFEPIVSELYAIFSLGMPL